MGAAMVVLRREWRGRISQSAYTTFSNLLSWVFWL